MKTFHLLVDLVVEDNVVRHLLHPRSDQVQIHRTSNQGFPGKIPHFDLHSSRLPSFRIRIQRPQVVGSLLFARHPSRWVNSLARALGKDRIVRVVHYAEDVTLAGVRVPCVARLTLPIRPAEIELVAGTPLESGWVQILQELEAALNIVCIGSVLAEVRHVRWLLQRSMLLDGVGRNDWNPDKIDLLQTGMWSVSIENQLFAGDRYKRDSSSIDQGVTANHTWLVWVSQVPGKHKSEQNLDSSQRKMMMLPSKSFAHLLLRWCLKWLSTVC
jgi:hypothetical protein